MKINEHDMTKQMLGKIRSKSSNVKNLIKEENESEMSGDFESSLDDVEKDYLDKDKSSFIEKVDPGAKITNYAVDKETENVTMGGTLANTMEWSYSKGNGVELGTPVGSRYVNFTKDDLKVLNTLVNYYDLWKNEWFKRFNEDTMLKK
tara:strand:+ start:3495 stop:3938 length:444 start_codon:yes stop_codon:yes gene_type:complete